MVVQETRLRRCHLLPRIIRLLVTGRLHTDSELIASRLVQAGWVTWDFPLAEALRGVWSAWWQSTLHAHPGPVPVRDALGVVTVATNSLRPWLNAWAEITAPAADAHLADLVNDVMSESRSPTCAWASTRSTTPLPSCWAGFSPTCVIVSSTHVSTSPFFTSTFADACIGRDPGGGGTGPPGREGRKPVELPHMSPRTCGISAPPRSSRAGPKRAQLVLGHASAVIRQRNHVRPWSGKKTAPGP